MFQIKVVDNIEIYIICHVQCFCIKSRSWQNRWNSSSDSCKARFIFNRYEPKLNSIVSF